MNSNLIALIFFSIFFLSQASQFCNSTTCYPCYYRCLYCEGPLANQCTTCTQNYVLNDNGTCSSCSQNCISCSMTSEGAVCETCASGFYLSQSTGTCKVCSEGAQTCTFSAVQTCKQGYYLLNSICFYCISNCLSCSDAYSCSLCRSGYYLTSQSTCSPCQISNCASCSSPSTSCSLCQSGYSGLTCSQLCPANCDICNGGICYQCKSTYFMGNNGKCQPMGLLCTSGSDYNSCYQCQEGAFMSGLECLPYVYTDGTNYQEYYTPINTPEVFRGNSNYCQDIAVFFVEDMGKVSFDITVSPNYKITLSIQLLIGAGQNVQISSSKLTQTAKITITSSTELNCNGSNFTMTNIKRNFTTNYSTAAIATIIQVQITGSGLIGVSQVVLKQYPCAVQNCGLCSNQHTCRLCLSSYYLQNNVCLGSCSQGYYKTQALQTCSLSCPERYYPVLATYLCLPCQSPCFSCSGSTVCVSCVDGYFLAGSSCLSTCPQGYYPAALTKACTSCQYPCSTCQSSATYCLSCSLGYLHEGTCMMSCPQGYYANLTGLICSLCLSPCTTCKLSPSTCTSCQGALQLQPNSTCLANCGTGFVAINGVCQSCSYPCSSCSGTIQNCTSCTAGFLYNNSCLTVCPETHYSNSSSKQCIECPLPCSKCLSATHCTECLNSSYFYSGNYSCLSSCPSGTYISSGQCVACEQPCKTCDSQGCLQCQGFLFVLHNRSCSLTCPQSTYLTLTSSLVKTCLNCSDNCLNCISSSQCLSCTNLTYLQQGQCTFNCSLSTYPYAGQCKSCPFPCFECISSSECLSCQTGYYHYEQEKSCVSSCPAGTYAIDSSCVKCHVLCSLCSNGTTQCLQCATDTYKNMTTYECQIACSDGYYPHSPTRTCKSCPSQCATCSSQLSCLTCHLNSTRPYLLLSSCLATCPSSYYPFNYTCKTCPITCLTCSNSTHCTSCSSSSFLTPSGTCDSSCPSSTYPSSGRVCLSCVSPCLNCLSPSQCLSCVSSGQVLYLGKCLSICPSGLYSITINNVTNCALCNENCLTCTESPTNCSSCFPSTYLFNFTCLSQCPTLTYIDSSSECISCSSPCLQCYSSSQCKSCIQTYFLYQDICMLSCPAGYYGFSNASICLQCVSPCSSCISSTICTSCIQGHYLDQTACISSCPAHTYAFSTSNGALQCLDCPSSCLTCHDSTACLSCYSNSSRPYLQGVVCQSSCTNGYYRQSQSFVCQACSQWCVICSSQNNCTQCSKAYLLAGKCIENCPETYYPSLSFICQNCIAPCLKCHDASTCQTCLHSFYLYLTHCLEKCPPDQWTVDSPNICNESCQLPYFRISSNKTCTLKCSLYHSADGECLSVCPGNQMANQTYGCQECAQTQCQLKLYFQVQQQQQEGTLKIMLIFNLALDNPDFFYEKPQTLSLRMISSEASNQQQLDIGALRNLAQNQQVSFSIVSTDLHLVVIEVYSPLSGVFSGDIEVSIYTLGTFTTQGYPVQNTKQTITVEWYQPSSSTDWTKYIGYLIATVFLICALINFIFDNAKTMVPLIDVMQTLHFLFYLEAWVHPALSSFIMGLSPGALRASLITFDTTLWDCSAKLQLVYGTCSLLSQVLFPAITLVLLILLNVLLSRLAYFRKRKWISWGQVYLLWWFCSPSLVISALTYLSKTQNLNFVLACIIIAIFGLLSLTLGFQVISNVYNKSYAQRVFFWNIKKKAGQLANLHALLLIVRRVCLVIGVGMASQRPLGGLFILTLLTVYIVSNMLINKPLRRMPLLQVSAEISFALFMILLQMSIVNATTFDQTVWNAFGWIMLILSFTSLVLLLILTIAQIIRCLREHLHRYRKEPTNDKQNDREGQIQQQSSVNSQEFSRSSTDGLVSKRKDKQVSRKRSYDTQNQLMKTHSQALSPKERISGFLGIIEGQDEGQRSKVPAKLIKLMKEETEKSEKIQ